MIGLVVGLGIFAAGMVGVGVGSRGERGWDRWDRRQRIICSVSFVLVLAGLIVVDATH